MILSLVAVALEPLAVAVAVAPAIREPPYQAAAMVGQLAVTVLPVLDSELMVLVDLVQQNYQVMVEMD